MDKNEVGKKWDKMSEDDHREIIETTAGLMEMSGHSGGWIIDVFELRLQGIKYTSGWYSLPNSVQNAIVEYWMD